MNNFQNDCTLGISQIRDRYLNFFKEKGHAIIEPVKLIPSNENKTGLFTNSGMFPLIKYLRGDIEHVLGNQLTNSQACFRTTDIDDVGDQRHTTCFEMLGNWSLNSYFKSEQLPMRYNFLINELGIDSRRLYQTVFAGEEGIDQDNESIKILLKIFQDYGINNCEIAPTCEGPGEQGISREIDFGITKIFPYGKDKNRWQRGEQFGEIGGPCSETFYDTGKKHDSNFGEFCHPNCDCGRFVEIGNSVFMEYIKNENGRAQMQRHNVDFGGGLERITMAANGNLQNIFLTDAFIDNIELLEKISKKKYQDMPKPFEIICDHTKSSTLLIKDGCIPSNKDQGYYLRKLIRRVAYNIDLLKISPNYTIAGLLNNIINLYSDIYPKLIKEKDIIIEIFNNEIAKYHENIKKIEKLVERNISKEIPLDEFFVFNCQTTHGIPHEISINFLKEKGIFISYEEIDNLKAQHQEISRVSADKKFKSHLGNNNTSI